MADGPVFELKLIGRLNAGQVAPRAIPDADPNVANKRRSQEQLRKLADSYKEEAFLLYVYLMRNSPDERVQMAAADRIVNRAVGLAKALSEEEKKGADAGSILDVLAAVSSMASIQERQAPDAPALEHEASNPDDNFEKLLDDINAEDAVLIDG